MKPTRATMPTREEYERLVKTLQATRWLVYCMVLVAGGEVVIPDLIQQQLPAEGAFDLRHDRANHATIVRLARRDEEGVSPAAPEETDAQP